MKEIRLLLPLLSIFTSELISAQNPPCYLCDNDPDATLSNPDVMIDLSAVPDSPVDELSCQDLYDLAVSGIVTAEQCDQISALPSSFYEEPCGCSTLVAPISAPVPVPVPAPVPVPIPAPAPVPVPLPVTAPVPEPVPVTTPVVMPIVKPVTAPITAPFAFSPSVPSPTRDGSGGKGMGMKTKKGSKKGMGSKGGMMGKGGKSKKGSMMGGKGMKSSKGQKSDDDNNDDSANEDDEYDDDDEAGDNQSSVESSNLLAALRVSSNNAQSNPTDDDDYYEEDLSAFEKLKRLRKSNSAVSNAAEVPSSTSETSALSLADRLSKQIVPSDDYDDEGSSPYEHFTQVQSVDSDISSPVAGPSITSETSNLSLVDRLSQMRNSASQPSTIVAPVATPIMQPQISSLYSIKNVVTESIKTKLERIREKRLRKYRNSHSFSVTQQQP